MPAAIMKFILAPLLAIGAVLALAADPPVAELSNLTAQLRRLERQLLLDDGRRRPRAADVLASASRASLRRFRSDVARIVDTAIAAGHFPPETKQLVEIQAVPPSLSVRDQLKDTQRYKIENAAGILSPQTWSQLEGLDYGQEQTNFAAIRSTPI